MYIIKVSARGFSLVAYGKQYNTYLQYLQVYADINSWRVIKNCVKLIIKIVKKGVIVRVARYPERWLHFRAELLKKFKKLLILQVN